MVETRELMAGGVGGGDTHRTWREIKIKPYTLFSDLQKKLKLREVK